MSTSKSLIGQKDTSEREWLGQSCILESLMVKINPDKHLNQEDHLHGKKNFTKNALIINHLDSKYHEKKMS